MTDHELIIACLLDPDLVKERVEEWRELAKCATERQDTLDGVELILPTPDLAATVAELVRAEHECCPFFVFSIRLDARGLSLEISAPPEARLLIDILLSTDTEGHEGTPVVSAAQRPVGPASHRGSPSSSPD